MSRTADDFRRETPERYAEGLVEAESLAALRAHVEGFAELAKDALPIVRAMTDAEFPIWRKGLQMERRGEFAGEDFAERYAALLLPEPMVTVADVAHRYQVPFDVAVRRLREVRPDLLQLRQEHTR